MSIEQGIPLVGLNLIESSEEEMEMRTMTVSEIGLVSGGVLSPADVLEGAGGAAGGYLGAEEGAEDGALIGLGIGGPIGGAIGAAIGAAIGIGLGYELSKLF